MTIEEVFQFIKAKEADKGSAECLLHTQGVGATRSQYCYAKQELKQHKLSETSGRHLISLNLHL